MADALAVAESDQHLSTRPIVISTQSSSGSSSPNHTHESYYGPPPPYSSHDPSSPSVPAEPNSAPLPSPPSSLLQLRATEAELKASLAQLKERIKSQQSNLNAPLASIKRSFEKSAKEEQRARQRISTLEEATRKLRAMAIEEAEGANTLNAEDVEPLQAEAAELSAKLQERRAQVHKVEVDAKKAMRDDEQVLKSLDSDIEESQHRIDGLKTERNRYESEVVPDLTHRLDSLAEELRQQELDDHQQEARHQQLAAAAASSWYNFAHHSNSSTSLHAFPGAPVAVYAPTPGATAMNQPATAANSTSTTRRWPLSSNNMQRAPLRSMTGNTSAPEWSSSQMTSGVSAQRRESLDSALGLQQTATPQTVPGLLPRFGSDPTQLTTAAAAKSSSPTKSYATMSTPPLQANAEDAPRSLQASPPSASAGSRFLSGFRKRSTSSMAAPQHHDPSNLTNADIPPASEGEKKADKEDSGMLLALGSKLTRPSSSDSQSGGGGGGKMSWSRVVGKGRTSAAAP